MKVPFLCKIDSQTDVLQEVLRNLKIFYKILLMSWTHQLFQSFIFIFLLISILLKIRYAKVAFQWHNSWQLYIFQLYIYIAKIAVYICSYIYSSYIYSSYIYSSNIYIYIYIYIFCIFLEIAQTIYMFVVVAKNETNNNHLLTIIY